MRFGSRRGFCIFILVFGFGFSIFFVCRGGDREDLMLGRILRVYGYGFIKILRIWGVVFLKV